MQNRPTGVMVIAILGIILGLLGCICNNPLSAIGQLMPAADMGSTGFPLLDEAMQAQANLPFWVKFTNFATMSIGWLLSLLLITGSIGAIMMKRWGRLCLVFWAPIYMVNTAIYFVVYSITQAPMSAQAAAQFSGGAPPPEGLYIAGFMCCGVFFLIYPFFVMYYMNRGDVKAAFENGGMGPGGWGDGGGQQWGPPVYGQQQQPYGYPPPQQGGWGQPDPNYPPQYPPQGGHQYPPQYGPPAGGPPPGTPPPQGYQPEGTPEAFEEDDDERR